MTQVINSEQIDNLKPFFVSRSEWYNQIITAGSGDITGVTAGDGLTGGGLAGDVTLDVVAAASSGLTVSADSITITLDTSPGLQLGAGGLSTLLDTNPGLQLGAGGLSIDLDANPGLVLGAGGLAVASGLAGVGLAFASGVMSVNVGDGLVINTDTVEVDLSATSGLEFDGSGDLQIADSIAGSGLNIASKVLSVDFSGIDHSGLAGDGLAWDAGNTELDVNVGDGLAIDTDNVVIDLATTSGLNFSTGDLLVGAGDGINVLTSTIEVDVTDIIDTNFGLTESTNDIRINLAATSGLNFSSGALLVGAGDGINVLTNTIEVDVTDFVGNGLVESGSDIVLGTPSTLTISTTNAVTASSHTHAITTSSDPGAAASILATDSGGDLGLEKLGLGIPANATIALDILNTNIPQFKIAYDTNNFVKVNVSSVGNSTWSTSVAATTGSFFFASGSSAGVFQLQSSFAGIDLMAHTGIGIAGHAIAALRVRENDSSPQLRLEYDATFKADFLVQADGDLQISPDTDLILSPGGGEVYIPADVGINVIAPAYALQVRDTALPQVRIEYDASNYGTFTTNVAGTMAIAATGNVGINPTGDVWFDPTGEDVYPLSKYLINLGTLQNKWLTLHAAELWVETLVAQNTIATIGGRILVGPTTMLAADFDTTSVPGGPQLLVNEGFETSGGGGADVFATWTEFINGSDNMSKSGIQHSGTWACRMQPVTGSSTTHVYQDITVVPGSDRVLTFYTRGEGTGTSRYRIFDQTNLVDIVALTSTGISGVTYTLVTRSYVVPVGCTTVRIYFYCSTTSLSQNWFDTTSDTYENTSSISVEHDQMALGDIAYMEADGKIEFLRMISVSSGSGPFSYDVERNLDGTGANEWFAGDAVFNTGIVDDGFIDLYSFSGVTSGTFGPTIVGNVRQSVAFSDWKEHWAIGNLNGVYGYGVDTYGAAFGDYDEAYMTIDPTSGIRFFDTTDGILGQLTGTALTFGNNAPTTGAEELLNTGFETLVTEGSELILNPGFETPGAGGADIWGDWIEIPGSGTLQNDTLVKHSGNDAARLIAGATPNDTIIRQNFAVNESSSYRFTFWVWADGTNAGQYRIYDITGAAFIVARTSHGWTSASWTQITVDITTPGGCKDVRFDLYAPSSPATAWNTYDDVSVLKLGFTNWTMVDNGDGGTSVDTISHTGTYSARVRRYDLGQEVELTQTFTPIAFQLYRLQFWTRGDGTNAGDYRVSFSSGDIIPETTTGVTGTTFTLVTDYFMSPASGDVTLHLRAKDGVYGALARFDDVSIVPFDDATRVQISAANGIRFFNSATEVVGQWIDNRIVLGNTGEENITINPFGVRIKNGSVIYAQLIQDTLTLGLTEDQHIAVDPTNGLRFFADNGSTVLSQWNSSIITIGDVATEHVNITSTVVEIKDGSTVYTSLVGGALTLGNSAAEHVFMDGTSLEFREGSTTYTKLEAGSLTVGLATAEHVLIDTTGVSIKNSGLVLGEWQADGDMLLGRDISDVDLTYIALFANNQTYNGEVMQAGDLLFGANTGNDDELTDGGLEIWTSATDLTNWGEIGTVNREAVTVRTGTYSAKLVASGTQPFIHQTMTLEPSTVYTLSGYVRTSTGQAQWAVYDVDALFYIVSKQDVDVSGGGWEYKSVEFVTINSDIRVEIYGSTTGTGVYWDDLEVRKGPNLNFLFSADSAGKIEVRRGRDRFWSFNRNGDVVFGEHLTSNGIAKFTPRGIEVDTSFVEGWSTNPSLLLVDSTHDVDMFGIQTSYTTNGTVQADTELWGPNGFIAGATLTFKYDTAATYLGATDYIKIDGDILDIATRITGSTATWGQWRRTSSEATADGVEETLTWQVEDADTDGMWTSGTTININTAGVFLIVVEIDWVANSTGRREVYIKRSGTNIAISRVATVVGTSTFQQCVGMDIFSDSQNITIAVRQNSGSAVSLNTAKVRIARIA